MQTKNLYYVFGIMTPSVTDAFLAGFYTVYLLRYSKRGAFILDLETTLFLQEIGNGCFRYLALIDGVVHFHLALMNPS